MGACPPPLCSNPWPQLSPASPDRPEGPVAAGGGLTWAVAPQPLGFGVQCDRVRRPAGRSNRCLFVGSVLRYSAARTENNNNKEKHAGSGSSNSGATGPRPQNLTQPNHMWSLSLAPSPASATLPSPLQALTEPLHGPRGTRCYRNRRLGQCESSRAAAPWPKAAPGRACSRVGCAR